MKLRLFALTLILPLMSISVARGELRAGAAAVDVTPLTLPVLVNGSMTSRSVSEINTPIYARAIVLDDGQTRLGIVVVDSCMMPRPLLDDAKQRAAQRTKIKPENMLISATHTHTAPSSMGALGTPADPTYVPFLREKLAEALAHAEKNLAPAQVGWGVGQAAGFTALRRWIRRPDRIADDPFGNPTVRANMHAGNNWDNVVGESGPEDPSLSIISIQSADGLPIAVLANFSMHYFGDRQISSDYFGLFCKGLEERLSVDLKGAPPLVGIMSHGCSGDIWRRDYKVPADQRKDPTIGDYSKGLLDIAEETYRGIKHTRDADLAMAERRLRLAYRVPDKQRLEWAERIVKEMGDRLPKTQPEVYAMEQVILNERQSTEIVVQAVRIGDIGIATTPNETYALTGLKVKLQSPLPRTMVIELANGGDGYIPPPEQHHLGGYNTWPARSAGLEIQAEPKITETALQLLEQVAQRGRREYRQSQGAAVKALLNAKPVAYWRLDEFSGPLAHDSSGRGVDGMFETGMAYFLDGPDSARHCLEGEQNRAAHFAGGRLRARLPQLADQYSISLWLWNGMPADARDTAGWAFSRDRDFGLGPHGDHLGVGGTKTEPGKLVFLHGHQPTDAVTGRQQISRWTWSHVVLVRDKQDVRVYLNGKLDIETNTDASFPPAFGQLFFGGRCDGDAGWEGRLDEIAVFDRALTESEVAALAPK